MKHNRFRFFDAFFHTITFTAITFSPLTPPSSIDNQEIYDAPDEDFPSPPPANSAYQYTEESYDVPENIDNGFGYGHGHARNPSSPPLPVTPPLSGSPFDDQDVYDTPDHDEFIPPAFSPPLPKGNSIIIH